MTRPGAAGLSRRVEDGDDATMAFYISDSAGGRILLGAACETLAAEAEA